MTGRVAGLLAVAGALGLAGVAPLRAQVQPQPTPQERFSVRIDTLVVRGNERNSDTDVIDRSGLRAGMTVQYPQIQDAIRRLFATGEYADVRILVSEEEPGVATLAIEVEERPTVTEYLFRGLESVSPGAIRDTVGLARNAPLDPARITRARALVERRLANEGFPRARVDTALVRDPTLPEGYQIVFRVSEGARLGVTEIAFEGNEAFSDGELRGAMETGEEGFFWWQAGELRRERYRRDLEERLPRFYARHGYLDFSVVDDTVLADPETGKGRILVTVEEGPRYRLAEFRIDGNRRFPTAELETFYPQGDRLESRDSLPAFDRVSFEEAAADIGDLYRNQGYLAAQVIPIWDRVRPGEGEPEGEESAGPPRVRARLAIREGNPTYVREIRIVGNTYTHDRIIRNRVLLFPGDIYSQQRLIQSFQRIQGLGFFEPLPPGDAIQFDQRQDGDLDITIRVQEQQTGTLNFGASASAATGLAGFIGYEQPNLFGQAKSGRFRWLFGGRQQDLELSYSDPEILGSDLSGTVSLRSSRDRFISFNLFDRRQTGGSVEVGMPLLGLRSTRLFVGYSLFRDEVDDFDTTAVSSARRELLTNGTRSSASVRIVRDTRNSSLFPTRGSRNSLSARFTGGVLGGNGEFGKIEAESQWFVPVAQIGGSGLQSLPVEITAGLTFEAGMILGENPFFQEQFFMGGTNVGISLRGYEENTITPLGHLPRRARVGLLDRLGDSYFKTTALIGTKLTSSLFVNTFVDAGNLWADAGDLNPSDLLVGAGVGVSLVTPFGPLGLDYAYGFDRRDVLGRPDPGWELHFKFGRIF